MNSSIQNLRKILKVERAPDNIWQQAFDHDWGHFDRLLNLVDNEPNGVDLVDYCLDIRYEEIQPDLLRYLLPVCLEAWRVFLLDNQDSKYGAFVEHFYPALANRPILKEFLGKREYLAVITFISNVILERIAQEKQLHFRGSSHVYKWFHAFCFFGMAFPSIEGIWNTWWSLKTPGQVIAAFQYASCLMYKDNQNPIFDPWTPDLGGGPPELWVTDGHVYDLGWKKENVDFIKSVLTVDYLKDKLNKASVQLQGESFQKSQKILADFDTQKEFLKERVSELPELLFAPVLGAWLDG